MEYMYLNFFANDNFPFFIQYGKHDDTMPIHYHEDFSELVLVLSGTAIHIVDNEKYFIKKGDVFVINKNTSHGYEKPIDFKICNIMFTSEYLFHSVNDIKKSAGFHALFVIEPYLAKEHNFNSRLTLNLTDLEKVKAVIDNMISEYSLKPEGYQTLIQAHFMELIVFLSRRYDFFEVKVKNAVINMANALSYMENHYKEPVTLQALAEKANLSPRHFTRIFRETYKTTPMNYILKLRLQTAGTLLLNSRKSILEIALETGFNDSNYFTRQFKSFYGITPTLYRKQPNKSRV